jgi:hypothetical protein
MQEGQVKRGVVSMKLIMLIILIIAAIAGGIIYKQYRTKQANSVEAYGTTFVTALVGKDGATTYRMFTDESKKQMTEDEWNQWVVFAFDKYTAGVPPLVDKQSVPDPNHSFGKNTSNATNLTYSFTLSGKSYTARITFVQVGNEWKVAQMGSLQ